MKLREFVHRWCSSGIGVRESVEFYLKGEKRKEMIE